MPDCVGRAFLHNNLEFRAACALPEHEDQSPWKHVWVRRADLLPERFCFR
jgi:hypothetical protein